MNTTENTTEAVFAGGCFWCTEAIFSQLQGVKQVLPGYMGGIVENPTYEQVCTGTTEHAEVVKIQYDQQQISYYALLEVFFATHDPTSLNKQGADVGTQYRSEIFYQDAKQQEMALEYIGILEQEKVYDLPIVTQVSPSSVFYVAEDYHKNYFNLNSNQPYCSAVVRPKIEKFQKFFSSKLKK